MKKVQYQHSSGRLYYYDSKGQQWYWTNYFKKWYRSSDDNQFPSDCNITKEEAKKLYPEAFKVKLP